MARWWHAAAILVGGPVLGVAIAGPPDLRQADTEVAASAGREEAAPPTTVGAPAPTTTTAPPPPPVRQPSEVKVRVYLAASVSGAATNATNKLRSAGYALLEPAWAPKDKPATTRVYFDPGLDREAHAVAGVLGVQAEVGPLVAGLPIELTEEPDILVLVGNDLAP